MSSPADDDAPITLASKLIDSAARDLKTYRTAGNPNCRVAGDAALQAIDEATRALQQVRVALASELYGVLDQPDARPRWTAGNSGPGY